MKIYFVTYQVKSKNEAERSDPLNVILKGIHPISWAATPPETVKAVGQVTWLLFWAEITNEQTIASAGWCNVEDYT